MRILISGTGRGGTNLLTELVKKITDVKFTEQVEDRSFFSRQLTQDYGTKLAIDHPTFTPVSLANKMAQYCDLNVIFSIRHPVDNCLSKIVRGQPASLGGDKNTENISDDGHPLSAIMAVKNLYTVISRAKSTYPNRVMVVKMENIIMDTKSEVDRISSFLAISPNIYEGFQENNRNKYQKGRYGKSLAPQVSLYEDLQNNFNGFFIDKEEIVCYIKDNLIGEISEFY